jgi:hypothetical protein
VALMGRKAPVRFQYMGRRSGKYNEEKDKVRTKFPQLRGRE